MTADEELAYIFVEIMNGRGNHGSFLRSFATAVAFADADNFSILRPVAHALVVKYNLRRYLEDADGQQKPSQRSAP
jgi:hypothetical protein